MPIVLNSNKQKKTFAKVIIKKFIVEVWGSAILPFVQPKKTNLDNKFASFNVLSAEPIIDNAHCASVFSPELWTNNKRAAKLWHKILKKKYKIQFYYGV